MHPLRAVLALRLAAACAPRYINVGMPKCGSTSIQSFYQCHGMTSAHWQISRGHYVGDETHACDARGRPLLDCGPCRDVQGTNQNIISIGLGYLCRVRLKFNVKLK